MLIAIETCHACGRSDMTGEGVEISGIKAYQKVYCNSCGEEWMDVFVGHKRYPSSEGSPSIEYLNEVTDD